MSNQESTASTDARELIDKATKSTSAGVEKMVELGQQAVENAGTAVQTGMDTAADSLKRASDQFGNSLGYSGEQGDRLSERSAQNMQAITAGGMLLTQAYHDIAREWFGLIQKQVQRNLAGLTALSRCQSVQEIAVLQSDHIRDSLRQITDDGRVIAQRSLRAVDEASSKLGTAVQPDER